MALELSFVPNGNKMISSYLDGGKDIGVKPIWECDHLSVNTALVADNPYVFSLSDTLLPLVMYVDFGNTPSGTITLLNYDNADNSQWNIVLEPDGVGDAYGNLWVFQFPNPMPIERGTFLSVQSSIAANWLSIYCERMGVIRKHCPIRAN